MTNPFGSLAVIADPAAGQGLVGERLPDLRRALEATDLEYDLRVTDSPGAGERFATTALDEGFRYVVAVGDDAAVQDVVNGLFRHGSPIVEAPVVGVIAAEAPNDLLRSFGMPDDVDGGVRHLLGENTYPLDVMRITSQGSDGQRRSRYAHNLAQVGLGANVELARRRLPVRLGERR
ncbi:MAG: acylglycerol kinase family protein, partial [Actinomycetota bacterium]